MIDNDSTSKQAVARIDELVRKVEALPDPFAREAVIELLQAVMELHSEALGRTLEIVSAAGDGASAIEALSADDLVASVLVLHGLHPDDVETRVRRAIDKLRLFFDSRGAGIDLVTLEPDAVRVRFTGARPGAGAAAKQVIEDAIYEAAPEIESLVIEGIEEQRASGFVPLSDLAAAQPL